MSRLINMSKWTWPPGVCKCHQFLEFLICGIKDLSGKEDQESEESGHWRSSSLQLSFGEFQYVSDGYNKLSPRPEQPRTALYMDRTLYLTSRRAMASGGLIEMTQNMKGSDSFCCNVWSKHDQDLIIFANDGQTNSLSTSIWHSKLCMISDWRKCVWKCGIYFHRIYPNQFWIDLCMGIA